MGGYYFRRTGDHQPTAAMTSFGAKVNNPVCRFDYVEIMFDDNDRVALISQPVKHAEQLSYIMKVQAGGRFVQHVKRAAGVSLRKFPRQLNALCFAT
tara:strand:+ start:229 stop:519 length:291 start_codon:yes stop_codon:yes gene_type:complete